MISVNQLTVRFGGFELFADVSFMINPRDRIGLVGKNGAGKTTLVRIISGLDQPSEGEVAFPPGLTVGYLPQHLDVTDSRTVFEEAKTAFDNILKLQEQIATINEQLSNRTDYQSDEYLQLIQQLTTANERLQLLGSNNIEAEIEQTLMGLGFRRTDLSRPTAEFSGGWRMRIELAKILLKRADLLLLDEPTNHLDIESIQWLEDLLKNYAGAVVLISHDRAFLDNITNRTIEITLGRIFDYDAPYSKFVELRRERREQQKAAYENQQKMIQQTEQFIERFRYKATKAVQVQSRIKQLEKLERIEIDEEDRAKIHFRFPPAPRSGSVVFEAENMTKRYGNHLVLNDINLTIERGEKVAFVGRNGEGKTTLARIIMNQLEHEGKARTGYNVTIGYFAQNQAQTLDESKTVFDTIDDVAVGDVRTKIRDILGAFLFSGETIEKKVHVLSGGERARLALAQLLLKPYSLLVLDEPTNHLDMQSKDILKQALIQYNGTLIIVSHDRYFLDGLIQKVFEFRDRYVKQHWGGIYDFLQRKKMDSLKELERKKEETAVAAAEEKPSTNKQLYLQRKDKEREIRKIENRIAESEQRIAEMEEKIEQAESKMAIPDPEIQTDAFYVEYNQIKKALEDEMNQWTQLNEELEKAEEEKTALM